jgi:purine-binding chemotaxis protein CheW
MNTNQDQYVLLEIEGTTYGIPSADVRHIEMVEHVTLVPNANPAIDGVVFSRGQVIPALNLRTRFGFRRAAATLRTRLVFVQVRERVVGLIVDAAREFLRIPAHQIRPIAQTLTGFNGNYLKAVANLPERLILLLDLEAVLDVERYEPAPENAPAIEPPAPAPTAPPATPKPEVKKSKARRA